MSYDSVWPPYVSVAERRRNAEATARKMAKDGKPLERVQPEGRKIATTFWGEAWCKNLEKYSDFANRLPRGRTYVRNGSVIDLKITRSAIAALVQGSELYKIAITVTPLSASHWMMFKQKASGKVANLLDLLQGKLPTEVLSEISHADHGLFPAPAEIKMKCSCPDGAYMCKHIAAALYGVGTRLDDKPDLFFTLRGVDAQELITAVTVAEVLPGKGKKKLASADLSELFGVDMDGAEPALAAKPKRAKKPAVALKSTGVKTLAARKKVVPSKK